MKGTTQTVYYISEQRSQQEMIMEYVQMSDQRNNETQGCLQSSLEGLTQLLKMRIEQDKKKWSVKSFYWLN